MSNTALTTTARLTGKIVGLLGALALVGLGASLVLFATNVTRMAQVSFTEGSFLIWLLNMGGGLVLGTVGLMALVTWAQTLTRKQRARH